MTSRLIRISKVLMAAGIPNTAEPSTDPEVVDDEIKVSETVAVSIGNGYMNVTVEMPDGCYRFIPANAKTVATIVKRALQIGE